MKNVFSIIVILFTMGLSNVAFSADKTISVLVLQTPEVKAKYKSKNIQRLLKKTERIFKKNKTTFKVKFKDIITFTDSEINEKKIPNSATFKHILKKSKSVRKLRLKYAADLVLVLADGAKPFSSKDPEKSGSQGFGFIPKKLLDIGKTPYTAFRLDKKGILTNTFAIGIAHEIGHNLGLAHGHNSSEGIRSYGQGYCDSGTYSTIMYYSSKCGTNKMGSYFSRKDPSFKKCNRLACGNHKRDSMRAINKDGLILAKWMSKIQPRIEVLIERYKTKMDKYKKSYTYFFRKRNSYRKGSGYYNYYHKRGNYYYNKHRKVYEFMKILENIKV